MFSCTMTSVDALDVLFVHIRACFQVNVHLNNKHAGGFDVDIL